MKKIVVFIQNNSLIITYKQNQTIREDLLNTNIISDSEIVFSDDYLIQNKKLVIPFFIELCEIHSIDTLTIQNNHLAMLIVDFFQNIKIQKIRIKKQENVKYELCEKLITMKYLKELDCYSIPNFMLEFLDKHHIRVTTHNEIFYTSHLMTQNKLTDYSKIYYQQKIKIYQKLTNEDKTDFISFLKMNHYLRVIDLFVFDIDDLTFLLEQLKLYRVKNVSLSLHENITNSKDFLFLKELNKKYKRSKNVIDLVYSEEYIAENIMKQIIINTLRLCGVVLALFIGTVVGTITYQNYKTLQEVSTITETVQKQIEKSEEEELPEELIKEENIIKNKYIASLLSINPDIVGYLKVNNTNIDYPVVQTVDNKYYLKKNLNHQDDQAGWIFMDFRNDDKILSDNTIIYGHNIYYSGVMFGTLHKVLNSSWNTNPDNLIISFDTLYESMQFQIYSIYTIPKTSDYLKVTFATEAEKIDYINLTKGRSIKNFDISVTPQDTLLTLSTCTDNNSRLVVHAKKLENTEA